MVSQKIVVQDPLGLHLRPAGKLCEICMKYQCTIQLRKGYQLANAKSVLGLLAARVQQGDTVEIICDGVDEEEALRMIEEWIQQELTVTEKESQNE